MEFRDGPDGCVVGGSDQTFGNLSAAISKFSVPPFYRRLHPAAIAISTVPCSTEDDGIDILSFSGTSTAESQPPSRGCDNMITAIESQKRQTYNLLPKLSYGPLSNDDDDDDFDDDDDDDDHDGAA